MISLNNINKKDIILAQDAIMIGKINGFVFNTKNQSLKYLSVTTTNNEEKFIKPNFLTIGDSIIINNSACIKDSIKERVGFFIKISQLETLKGLSIEGKNLGNVADIVEDDNKAVYIVFSRARFLINQIKSISQDIIIINTKIENKLKSRFNKQELKTIKSLMEKAILSATRAVDKPQKNIELDNEKSVQIQTLAYASPIDQKPYAHFLLGKKTTKNIYAKNNSLLIPMGTIITEKELNLVKQHNKIIKLTLSVE